MAVRLPTHYMWQVSVTSWEAEVARPIKQSITPARSARLAEPLLRREGVHRLVAADVVLADDDWVSVFEEFRGKLESADLVDRCGGCMTVSRTEGRGILTLMRRDP